MAHDPVPMTQAIRTLSENNVSFSPHFYRYEDRGGTAVSSRELGVPEHAVIKTLVMETDEKCPLIVLMHGDAQVSVKNLARLMGVKTVSPCATQVADRHSGYQVGGTSPFGTKKKMPVYMQSTIMDLDKIYINGGKRGFLVSLSPQDVVKILRPVLADIRA